MTRPTPRPAPVVTEDNAGFWAAAAEGRLVVQRCGGCRSFRHPPRPMCPACHSLEQSFVEAAGTGVLYSYALLHHPRHPAFTYPVIAALVELDEGVRLVTTLVAVEPEAVRIGMAVEVAFEAVAGDSLIPVFRPREVAR
jgi:uncharacterized OB-fold protein